MRVCLALLVTALSTLASNAQQWGTQGACAPAPVGVNVRVQYQYTPPARPTVVYREILPAAPVIEYRQIPAYIQAPAVFVAPAPQRRFPTPVRDFFFGRW